MSTRPSASRLPLTIVFVTLLTLPAFTADMAGQTHRVTLTEGTNMAAAVSPDGTELAIDLVGRIWLLPIEGGAEVDGTHRREAWRLAE